MPDFQSMYGSIDYSIHVHRLCTDFENSESVLQWILFYQTDRSQYISSSDHCSVMHIHVYFRIQFLALFIFRCILIICLSLLILIPLAEDFQQRLPAPHDKISYQLHSVKSYIRGVKAWATANTLNHDDIKPDIFTSDISP